MPDNKKNTAYLDTGGIYLDTGVAIERVNINGENKLKIRSKSKSPSSNMIYIPGKPKSSVADLSPPRQKYDDADVVKHLEGLAAKYLADKGPQYGMRDLEKLLPAKDGAFPGISTYQVRKAWGVADLPPAWRETGPRRK